MKPYILTPKNTGLLPLKKSRRSRIFLINWMEKRLKKDMLFTAGACGYKSIGF